MSEGGDIMNILDTLKSVKKATENYLNSVQTPDEDYISKIYNYVVNIENLTTEESEFLNKFINKYNPNIITITVAVPNLSVLKHQFIKIAPYGVSKPIAPIKRITNKQTVKEIGEHHAKVKVRLPKPSLTLAA